MADPSSPLTIVLDTASVHRTPRMRLWDAWWHFVGWPIYKRRNDGPWRRR